MFRTASITKNKRGFTLIEILIVMIIAGLGMMTVAPRIAENTILTDRSEVFFQRNNRSAPENSSGAEYAGVYHGL